MTLGELRRVLSVTAPMSICDKNTLSYNNYTCIKDVPSELDNLEVYGVGLTNDFAIGFNGERRYMPLVEIMVAMEQEKKDE